MDLDGKWSTWRLPFGGSKDLPSFHCSLVESSDGHVTSFFYMYDTIFGCLGRPCCVGDGRTAVRIAGYSKSLVRVVGDV